MAKISGLINNKEREIAARIRKVRYSNQLSQPAFARKLAITRDRLASIEYGRTPLIVQIADKISEQFDINLIWMSTGRGLMQPTCGLILQICQGIKGNDLFSNVDIVRFQKLCEDAMRHNWLVVDVVASGQLEIRSESEAAEIARTIHLHFDQLFGDIPLNAKRKLLPLVIRTLVKFDTDWVLGNRTDPGENIVMLPHYKKSDLTQTTTIDKKLEVKAQLPNLLERLNRATQETGKMSALAGFLGVPLASVSRWLAGKREPGGEITLKLLKWVEQQERQ